MEKFKLPDGKEIEVTARPLRGIVEDLLIPIGSFAQLLITDDMHETVNRGATGDVLESLIKSAVDAICDKFWEIEKRIGRIEGIYAVRSDELYLPRDISPGDLVDVQLIAPAGNKEPSHEEQS